MSDDVKLPAAASPQAGAAPPPGGRAPWPWLARVLGVVVLYLAAGKVGLLLASPNGNVSPVWPPAGFSLVALLLGGNRLWPGIWLGAFLTDTWLVYGMAVSPVELAVAAGMGGGSVLEALLGAGLMRRWTDGAYPLATALSVVRFALVAMGMCVVGATVGTGSLCAAGVVSWGAFGETWVTWWLGDLTGVLVVTPLLLAWGLPPTAAPHKRRLGEALLLVCLLTFSSLMAFTGGFQGGRYPLGLLMFPGLVWAALRFQQRAVTLAITGLAGVAIGWTVAGEGPFVMATVNESLLTLQTFVGVFTLATLTLSAAVTERQRAVTSLSASETRYRTLIERMGEGLVQVDNDDYIRFVNPQICRMLGYAEAELLGQHAGTLLLASAEDRAAMVEHNRRRAAGVAGGYEIRLRKKSGESLLAWHSATPVTAADGRVVGSMAIVTDITERKRTEEAQSVSHERALRQRAAIARLAFDETTNSGDERQALQRLTEELAAALQVERAGIWLMSDDGTEMRCLELFEAGARKHSEGAVIPAALCPRYWHALQTETRINADDALTDPRTSEFADSYLIPLGITSMLDAVIQMEGKPAGVICLEHTGAARHWEPDEESFANTAAALVAQILVNAERRRAEAALRESEGRFHVVADAAPVMIWLTGPDKRCTYVNQPWLDFTSHTLEENLGFGWTQEVHPDDLPPVLTSYDQAFAARQPFVMEYRLRRHDGEYRRIEARGVPRFEAGGRFAGYAGSCTDITERRRAEDTLRESEERFRLLFEGANDAIFWADAETGLLTHCNRAAEVLLGRERAEIIGQPQAFLHPPEEADRYREILRVHAASESKTPVELEVIRKDGQRVAVSIAPSVTRIAGKPVIQGIFRDVTERQRTEAALRESEARTAGIVGSAMDAIISADSQRRVVLFNAAAERMFGYRAADMLGQPLERFMPPRFRPDHAQHVERFGQAGVTARAMGSLGQISGLRANGEEFPIEASISQIGTGEQKIFTAILRDITDRQRAEARLVAFADLGRKLSAVQTEREAGEIIVEVADRLIGWDSCVVNLYSAASDTIRSVLRKDILDGQRGDVPVSVDERTPTARARRVFAHGGELLLREASEFTPTDTVPFGDVTRPSLSLMTVPIRDGARAIGLLSIQSYQPQAYTPQDLELLQALADHCAGALNRLHAEEEARRLAAFPQMNPNPVLEFSAAGEILYCNAAATYLASELGFARPSEMLPPETPAIVRACLGAGLKQQRLELPYGKRVISWSFYPIPLRGVVHCYAGDVTQRRSLEEQLRQSQKMEAIGQLAGGIAHDFNNILGAILGNVEMARTMPPDDPDLPASLDAIFQASRRAADLVKQILAFSRRQEQRRQPLQLALVVREVVKLLRATVPATVEFQPHLATMPVVLADPSAIHQVAMNLCTNAWHALRGQPGVIRVELAEQTVDADLARQHPDLRPGRYVRLTVADNGCGMDAATRERIFEPFFTTKPAGTGTGLGLALVHGIIKSHEGGIVVTSAPGQGTTFELYFPVFGAEVGENAVVLAPMPRGAGEHILFVDDEQALAALGKTVLTRLGYRVTVCTSPTEALAVFRARPGEFDLVLTDFNMPGMNGCALGAQVLAARPEQRIILTTGFSADVTEAVARELGFSELLPKPYDMHSLAAAVQRVLHAPKFTP